MVFLYNHTGMITGRRLAKLLGLFGRLYPDNREVTIRWGNSLPATGTPINTAEAISLAADGLNSLQVLKDAGIRVPEVFTTIPESDVYPLLGRRRNHRSGLDIVWVNNAEEARRANRPYFTRFIEIDKELRIHVFGTSILKMFIKVPRGIPISNRIRTSQFGWGYHKVSNSFTVASDIAVRAVAALGLDFGAVDLGWNEETKRYIVFEVNTAPSLNSDTIQKYMKRFKEYLEGNYVPEGHSRTKESDNAD